MDAFREEPRRLAVGYQKFMVESGKYIHGPISKHAFVDGLQHLQVQFGREICLRLGTAPEEGHWSNING